MRCKVVNWLFLAACLTACTQKPEGPPALEALQTQASEVITPAVVAIRESVQDATNEVQVTTVEDLAAEVAAPAPSEPVMPDPAIAKQAEVYRLATALIVRWEITSPSVYTRRYQGIICPGGSSGPTRGVGWDDGHQTRRDITAAWHMHPLIERIVHGSGQVGDARCKAFRGQNRDIITPYSMAELVFLQSSLPAYCDAAARTYGPGFRDLSAGAQAALCSVQYNRGGATVGEKRREIRTIRDVCVVNKDYPCIANELISMCRLWVGTPNGQGLCDRRKDEARVALL